MISISEFQKLNFVVGVVMECLDHPKADKLLLVKVDLGGQERQLVAGIKGHYEASEIVGKKVVVLENLQPAVLRGEKSEGMLLAATDPQGKVVLLTVDREIEAGSKIS